MSRFNMKSIWTLSLCLFAQVPALASDHPYETDALRVPELKTGGSCGRR